MGPRRSCPYEQPFPVLFRRTDNPIIQPCGIHEPPWLNGPCTSEAFSKYYWKQPKHRRPIWNGGGGWKVCPLGGGRSCGSLHRRPRHGVSVQLPASHGASVSTQTLQANHQALPLAGVSCQEPMHLQAEHQADTNPLVAPFQTRREPFVNGIRTSLTNHQDFQMQNDALMNAPLVYSQQDSPAPSPNGNEPINLGQDDGNVGCAPCASSL